MKTLLPRSWVVYRVGGLALLCLAILFLPGWTQEGGRREGKKAVEAPHKTIADKVSAEQLRNEVELLEAQLEVHKALIAEAEVRLKVAKEHLALVERAAEVRAQAGLQEARGQVQILEAQLKVKLAERGVADVRLKHARQRLAQAPKSTQHQHDADWWCQEHGIPEDICSLCLPASRVKELFKDKGDWCEIHKRAKSQCFKCDPSLYAKFEKMYEDKYGKKPERPPEKEFRK